MMHTIEIPELVPATVCIACGSKLRKPDLDKNMALCLRCSNLAMVEHAGIIITHYGVETLREYQQKINYQNAHGR